MKLIAETATYHPVKCWSVLNWTVFLCILVVSVLVRVIFFTGFGGADEVNYTAQTLAIAEGTWERATHIGALRYGAFIPMALFVRIFGPSEISVNVWPFLCSIGEITLVFFTAHVLWGLRAAFLSSTFIALVPLHIHYAGRLMVDAPLTFTITASFVLFLIAERQKNVLFYLLAGLAGGLVFWIKGLVIAYFLIFTMYVLIHRDWYYKWIWMTLGVLLMVGVYSFLLLAIMGDPFYLFKLTIGSASKIAQSADDTSRRIVNFYIPTSPYFYFRYLFIDGRHTWIMPYLSVIGIIYWLRKVVIRKTLERDTAYIIIWGLWLICFLSFLPASLNPFRFWEKGTSYMLLFIAPLSLLAGYALNKWKDIWILLSLCIIVVGSLTLAALEQQSVRVFTSNSKASVTFAKQNRQIPIYGMTNAVRAAQFAVLLDGKKNKYSLIKPLSDLQSDLDAAKIPVVSDTPLVNAELRMYVIIDLETIDWGIHPITKLADVPPCWQQVTMLQPEGLGTGDKVLHALHAGLQWLPQALAQRLSQYAAPYLRAKPAYVYGVPKNCSFSLKS